MTAVEPPLPDLLARNLRALHLAQPFLCERVHWPVDGDHLFRDATGAWTYQLHQTRFPFALEGRALEESLDAVLKAQEQADTREVILFGLGLGEQLRALLDDSSKRRVLAWDRDPWILRQVLGLQDWSEELASGRLRFALGPDLFEHLAGAARGPVVRHPLLARVYHNEHLLLESGLGDKRALVCVGALFVESLMDALREEGYSVYSFDAQRLAPEELELVLERFDPDLLAGINYVNGLAECCAARELDYFCWEVDPATDEPRPLQVPAPRAHVFTYRAANVASFRSAGFERVEYLPLAADPLRRHPLELSSVELGTYGSPVSFVGTSLMSNVRAYQELFLTRVEGWSPGLATHGRSVLREVVRRQREDFSSYRVPELLEQELPGLRAHCLASGLEDPTLLIGELCAAEKRLNYLVELAGHDVAVWGDGGWALLEDHGVEYRGLARHEHDLPRIYCASTINLDIGRLYQDDIVTMRIFDILACGGFVLAEHSAALAELFEIGFEVASYRTLAELRQQVVHYLAHPDEARTIAERGRAAVLARHDIPGRVRHMLASFDEALDEPARRWAVA
jgi:spore maturation protein CgeB